MSVVSSAVVSVVVSIAFVWSVPEETTTEETTSKEEVTSTEEETTTKKVEETTTKKEEATNKEEETSTKKVEEESTTKKEDKVNKSEPVKVSDSKIVDSEKVLTTAVDKMKSTILKTIEVVSDKAQTLTKEVFESSCSKCEWYKQY